MSNENDLKVVSITKKSTTTAVLLALFFGPIGAFYSSITMGLISFVCSAAAFGVGLLLGGIGTIVTVPLYLICNAIFCGLSVKRQNSSQEKSVGAHLKEAA